jgi:hypothetical protein
MLCISQKCDIESYGKTHGAGLPFKRAQGANAWTVYHFLDHRNQNEIVAWLDRERVGSGQRAKFQNLIDLVVKGGPENVPGFIQGPVAKDIYKAKIKGNKGEVQLRPRLCHGPLGEFEFTFLCGAIEKDNRDRPENCNETAQTYRTVVINDPNRRRAERIDGSSAP